MFLNDIPTTPRTVNQLSVILSSAIDKPEQTKEPEESFTVSLLFLRYIMAYHYEVFQKLESVCKEISFSEVKSKDERHLKLTAREDMDTNKFSKTVDTFIYFYQIRNQNMLTVAIEKLPKYKMDVLSEARATFSVVIDSAQDPDEITIFGERDNVHGALKFLRNQVGVLTSSTPSSSSKSKGAMGGSPSRGTTGTLGSSKLTQFQTELDKIVFSIIKVTYRYGRLVLQSPCTCALDEFQHVL